MKQLLNGLSGQRKKADWFDPIIAREDELFGKREHEKNAEQKVLKKSRGYWW